ncbi:transcriptional regulator with XRE-family HTH domain [Humibacillus xanthopallidus]|uniref:Transcriptional regulator with XRE-family HTH domain n=1 Tax=Humibacillus xanthopallidus TaxID=412689 RepID=A0A543PPC5_9MICO|nr:helix-turn-helix transcriptional regulator [Humibacillus xanthopallidus]TQN45887.1 transcriptional regulator with XRE-family HTH domain [Humibacillus xanthopallidus]
MAARDQPTTNDLKEFLTTRRAKITPEQSGLPLYGANRRVAGLRREEVALLAGISVEYYTRLERGSVGNVSEGVLDGLVHALQLDEAERDHLYRLVRAASAPAGRGPRRAPTRRQVRPALQRVLDQMLLPAFMRNGRFDVLAANDLGRALYSPLYAFAAAHTPGEPPNSARFIFLDPHASEFFIDHDRTADDCVAFLRAEAGRDPYDKALSDLVGELSTRSEDFRRRWAAHDVRYHRTGRKRLHHPLVGDLELDYEAFELPGDPGQRVNVYTAPPDSPSDAALNLLASWTARDGSTAREDSGDLPPVRRPGGDG